MVAPHELKNKTFTRTVRGYNPSEVDEHIAFLLEAYTDLYKENDEYIHRVALLEEQLEKYTKDSEAIRSALLNAQKVSEKIISDANEKSEIIIKSVKDACDEKLDEIKADIVRQCKILNTLKKMNGEYAKKMIEVISSQSRELDELPDISAGIQNADDEIRAILETVKTGIADMKAPKED